MTETARVETARKAFAEATGALEDAAIVATERQAAPDLVAARQSCDRLIDALGACLAQLQRLRRRLE